jgi:uncharacterized repeat protein (TIGR02543 family)
MKSIFKTPGFRSAAVLCAVIVSLALFLSGCPQPAGGTQYTITFDSHGGTAAAAITADEGTAVNRPADPSREGYTFLGWFSAETGGTLYTWPHTLTASVTMHAQWQDDGEGPPVQYTVTFETNGGGDIPPQTVEEGGKAVRPEDPDREGWAFSGWYSDSGLTAAYDFDTALAGDITLYARWLESYAITYELNGGTNNPGNPAAYTIESALTLSEPTREGYTFMGWYDNADLSGTAVTGISAGSTGDKAFYARWLESYTINYYLNDGTNDPANPATYTVESVVVLADPARAGYTFDGWYDAATGGNAVTGIPEDSTGDKAFYARWTPVTYTVTYNANGGSGTTVNSAHTYDQAAALSANGFSRTGYTFAGWNTQADGGGTNYADEASVSNLATTQDAVVPLYARWTAISYNISYELNGGTSNPNPATYTIESDFTLAAPVWPNQDYGFAGWYDAASGGNAVTGISAGSMGPKTFYAKWKPRVDISISLEPVPDDPVLDNASLFEDESANFDASGAGYTAWQWYWNGTAINGETSSTYTLAANSRAPGIYELSVTVRSGGLTLSAQCRVTIKAR